jgi:hypothetical protein
VARTEAWLARILRGVEAAQSMRAIRSARAAKILHHEVELRRIAQRPRGIHGMWVSAFGNTPAHCSEWPPRHRCKDAP